MQVQLPYVVQDQLTATAKGMKPVESYIWDDAQEPEGGQGPEALHAEPEHFFDGPVSRRVAVLDFDETNGSLRSAVPFTPPGSGRRRGRYELSQPYDPDDRAFQAVSVFSTVHKTMRAFETLDVLGRRLRWAFDGPQLLVVPRAGRWANAFYERESRSLQFFFFPSARQPGRSIFTSLSHDIVAHETGHAILDAIAPDLYNAFTPQSLALHEAIADLTSLVVSLESRELRKTVLDQTGGRIDGETAISSVAEEFGSALGSGAYLRSLWNDKTLDPSDDSRDRTGAPNTVDRTEPHDLSQVMSGALYRILAAAHLESWKRVSGGALRFSDSGRALAIATEFFRRFAFRALDYLPPGDVSFADYGRAICAADLATNPGTPHYRDLLARELTRRGVVSGSRAFATSLPRAPRELRDINLEALLESDWLAYDFVNRHRKLLNIPDNVPFRVLPRLAVEKRTFRGDDGAHHYREFVLKVAWEEREANPVGRDLPQTRAIVRGTTLAIDRDTRALRARLTTDNAAALSRDRTRYLTKAVDLEWLGPHSGDPTGVFDADTSGAVLRLSKGARGLHLAGIGA